MSITSLKNFFSITSLYYEIRKETLHYVQTLSNLLPLRFTKSSQHIHPKNFGMVRDHLQRFYIKQSTLWTLHGVRPTSHRLTRAKYIIGLLCVSAVCWRTCSQYCCRRFILYFVMTILLQLYAPTELRN